ncbi:MAG: M15 family metallopeptidase [Minisyncoccia bacterium]
MENPIEKHINLGKLSLILGSIVFVAISASGYFVYSSLSKDILVLKNNMSSSTQILNQRIANLVSDLASTTLTSQELSRRLLEEQNKSAGFQASINNITGTVNNITGTVGNLEKLSKTDKELLQKYSKVYFLSDNYVPMSLSNIDKKYLYNDTKNLQFHTSALPFLERMLNQANSEGIPLKIASAYRSFGEQSTIKNNYLITYGSGANQFSADQGYSEHQLGTAVDIANGVTEPALEINFEETPSYVWLTNNAYRYGFIISYTKSNVYYQYEPWHWRFVGVGLATKLHNDGISFSAMEQRVIDTYLLNIFD